MSKNYDIAKKKEPCMNLIAQLEALGLNGRQAKVYLALLQLGSAGAIEIAKTTGLKHPTVYDVLEILKARQLVSESSAGSRKRFVAEDPGQLRIEADERARLLDGLLPDLQALYRGGGGRPRVRFYSGGDESEIVNRELLEVRSKEYFYFGGFREMLRNSSEDSLGEYYRRRLERGIWSNAIRIHGPEEAFDYMQHGERHLRRLRYLPRPIAEDAAGLYLYDDRVAVTSALQESYAIIIESRELALLLKHIWQCIWDCAIPPEEYERKSR